MSVYEGSRYENAEVIRTRDADGETRPTLYIVMPGLVEGLPYRSHIVKDGERYDTIATRLWGDPELWWRIANLNPEHLYPGEIPAGTVIRLPAS